MNTPLLTWGIVVVILLLMLAVKFIINVHRYMRIHANLEHHRHHRKSIIRIGSENEELFLPGDTLYDHSPED